MVVQAEWSLLIAGSRAVWARTIPARMTPAPTSCAAARSSPSQTHATRMATTGSNMAITLARGAGMCARAATNRPNGTNVPITTIHVISSQAGAWCDESQAERKPDAPPDGPMQHVARPEGDDQRREVLDQERDPDREPVDGEEVEPLDERHAADAERDEKRELGPSEPQGGGSGERQD